MKIIVIILFIIVLSPISGMGAGELNERPYSVSFEAMGGGTYNMYDDNFKSKKLKLSPSLRIMWRPGHRLYMGLEATYITIRTTQFEKNKMNLQAKLEAFPTSLVVMMDLYGIDLIGGLGVGFIRSTIETSNDVSEATNWYYCINFGLGYTQKLSKSLAAGLEAKLFSFTKTDDLTGGLYFKLMYLYNY